MNKQAQLSPSNGASHARQYVSEVGQKALHAFQDSAHRANVSTERAVRRHPMASMGIAFGSGIAIASLGYYLLSRTER